MSSVAPIVLGAHGIGAADVVAIARHRRPVVLSDEARRRVERSAAVIQQLADGPDPVYGVSTGFGSLATTWIPPERREELQRSLVRSHAAGMGPLVEPEVVRALVLLRARAFAAHLMALRPHPGQTASADNLRRLLGGSPIVASHRTGDPRVQDAYSLRCTPQVHGAARDTFAHAAAVAEIELRSSIDNPSVVPGPGQPPDWADVPLGAAAGEVASCGHFHGAPVGFVCDFAAVGVAELGAIAERRTDRLLDRTRSQGLPPFLAGDPGVDSGLMIAQYTQAAMVAENRRLAVPASVDSLPTSAMQEDHVSMGWGAARKLRQAVANLERILAVELVCAARALDLRAPLRPAAATAAVVDALRAAGVGGPGPDRELAPELAAAERAVADGTVLAAAESAVGTLR